MEPQSESAASAAATPAKLVPLQPELLYTADDAAVDAATSVSLNVAGVASAASSVTSNEDDDCAAAPTLKLAPRRRGHRAQSGVWRLLTPETDPHKTTVSTCMHCHAAVPHHHKSEKARAHLKRCVAFRRHMATVDAELRPEWVDGSDSSTVDAAARRRARQADATGDGQAKRAKPPAFSLPHISAVTDAVAMYIYMTGAPFSTVEDPYLRRMVDMCLPPPTAVRATPQDLRGPLLQRATAAMEQKLRHELARPGTINTVCVNSWYARQELGIDDGKTLHAVGNKDVALFVDETPTVDDAELASPHVMSDHIARTFTLCSCQVHGVVTDNTQANQVVWAKYKTFCPHKFYHGCASHGLHLFIQQIFSAESTSEDAEPVPFADLSALVSNCREIVRFVNESETQVGFKQKLEESGLHSLVFPRHGQWSKLKDGFESVVSALPIMASVIESEESDTFETVRMRLKDLTNHSALLLKAIALLEPLDSLLSRLEKDPSVPISDVFYWFAKQLPVALSRVSGLNEAESAYLLKLNQIRFNAMYGDSHGMAYLLDPRYVGEGLSPDVRKNIEDLIFIAPMTEATTEGADADTQKMAIAQELTEYVIEATQEKASNTFRYSILSRGKKTVTQYWMTDGQRWPLLQRLASRLFNLPASTVPMVKKVLEQRTRLPQDEDLPHDVISKIKFLQLNEALLPRRAPEEAHTHLLWDQSDFRPM